ncbi:MAG: trypsin-like serine protease [Holosporales bacterium]|nr:trypsin-like serine protease [Holosporales bacterium]
MHHIFYRALLAIFISLQAVASEEDLESLEEHRLPIYQAEHYQIVKIHPYTHKNIAIFIESSPGKAIPQTSEVISYDESSPEFMPHFCEDKVYEFPQKGKERLEVRQAENDEFDCGRMDEVKDAFKAPYKFFGNLLITFPYSQESRNRPGRCIGSGLLMGPNQVLTAGHNLYDHKRGGWAQEIIFTPAQQGEQKPFGEARATVLKAFKGWIENKAENHDMGVLILDRSIGSQVGWAGLAIIDDTYYLTQKPSIAIAGYPSTDVQLLTQEGAPRISHALLREHQGDVLKAEASRLYYKINTRGGQSGGPIVAYLEELKGYFVLGIHTHAHDEANEGTRLTATKFWAIHECREQFDMPQSSSISVHKLTTITQSQAPSSLHSYEGQIETISQGENTKEKEREEEEAPYALVQKKQRATYEQATGREDNQEEQLTLKAHGQLFQQSLISLQLKLPDPTFLTLFICYSPYEGEEHGNKIRTLAEDLALSGIPDNNIFYDEWANRPGGPYTIHQYQDSIFKVSKVLVVGSQSLKEQYEREGRGFTSQAIELLRTRISKQGVQGIIPLWFGREQEDNFPSALINMRGEAMEQDYFLKFYDLLQDIHPAARLAIQGEQQSFKRQRASINPAVLALHADKEAKEQQQREQEDQAMILKALGLGS